MCGSQLTFGGIGSVVYGNPIKVYKELTDSNARYIVEDSDDNVLTFTEEQAKGLMKQLMAEFIK